MAGHSHSANIAHRKGLVDAKRGKLFSKLCRRHLGGRAERRRRPQRESPAPLRDRQGPVRTAARRTTSSGRSRRRPANSAARISRRCLRGLRPGRGGRALRGADRQPQSHRRRAAPGVRGLRRQPRRQRVRQLHVQLTRAYSSSIAKHVSEERLMEVALEAGADDVELIEGYFEVTCDPKIFEAVRKALEMHKIPTEIGRDQLHSDHLRRPRRRERQEDAQAQATSSTRTTTSRTSTPTTSLPRKSPPARGKVVPDFSARP